ncbi:MAG: hypothetical protein KatS3mg115_2532 [Candidatus Poribacteria bacterium]|nr:MAG: hypothetical protein KatS3mg115_2532 [Candidatus Poribacteria bacterium]
MVPLGHRGETDQPWGHTADRRPIPPGLHADNAPVLGPAGRVHSTLRDWARFIALSLRGARGEEDRAA